MQDRLLGLIGDTMGLLELEEFRDGLMVALRNAVPAHWVAISDVGPDPDTIMEIIDPPYPAALEQDFRRLYLQNPLVEHFLRTRDGRAMRFSDVTTMERLHELEIYAEVYQKVGIEHQIAFTLPSAPDRILGIVLSREKLDFSDTERDLLNAARPRPPRWHGRLRKRQRRASGSTAQRHSQLTRNPLVATEQHSSADAAHIGDGRKFHALCHTR